MSPVYRPSSFLTSILPSFPVLYFAADVSPCADSGPFTLRQRLLFTLGPATLCCTLLALLWHLSSTWAEELGWHSLAETSAALDKEQSAHSSRSQRERKCCNVRVIYCPRQRWNSSQDIYSSKRNVTLKIHSARMNTKITVL